MFSNYSISNQSHFNTYEMEGFFTATYFANGTDITKADYGKTCTYESMNIGTGWSLDSLTTALDEAIEKFIIDRVGSKNYVDTLHDQKYVDVEPKNAKDDQGKMIRYVCKEVMPLKKDATKEDKLVRSVDLYENQEVEVVDKGWIVNGTKKDVKSTCIGQFCIKPAGPVYGVAMKNKPQPTIDVHAHENY